MLAKFGQLARDWEPKTISIYLAPAGASRLSIGDTCFEVEDGRVTMPDYLARQLELVRIGRHPQLEAFTIDEAGDAQLVLYPVAAAALDDDAETRKADAEDADAELAAALNADADARRADADAAIAAALADDATLAAAAADLAVEAAALSSVSENGQPKPTGASENVSGSAQRDAPAATDADSGAAPIVAPDASTPPAAAVPAAPSAAPAGKHGKHGGKHAR